MFCICRPVVILEIGVAVLVAVFFMVYIATRYNPPKDPLFYGMSSDLICWLLKYAKYTHSIFYSDPQNNKQVMLVYLMIKKYDHVTFL